MKIGNNVSDPLADELTAEVVANYLRDNPDYFLTRRDLVDSLALPNQEQGAVSLVHVQLNRQRQRIEELEEEITALMSLAASNDRTFHEFMGMQESILNCTSLQEVLNMIEDKAKQLGLRALVRLSSNGSDAHTLNKEYAKQFMARTFNGRDAFLGRMRKVDRDNLFGENAGTPEMGSYVVLPLNRGGLQGILAFTSEDGGHFQPSMDTLFLRHLALVLSHLVLTLPWQVPSDERCSSPIA